MKKLVTKNSRSTRPEKRDVELPLKPVKKPAKKARPLSHPKPAKFRPAGLTHLRVGKGKI